MGLAALFVGVLIAVAILVTIVYGSILGLVRAGRFLWKFLMPEEGSGEVTGGAEDSMELPCWEEKECPPSVREVCPAYLHRAEELPCWLANLQTNGRLKVSCLTCERFNANALVA